MEDSHTNEGPKLNPELELRAKLGSISKLRAWLEKKEPPSIKQRFLEGLACAVVGGIIVWLVLP